MPFNIKKYINNIYGSTRGSDITCENNFYDYVYLIDRKIITFELKERSKDYDDILLEAIQKTPLFSKLAGADNLDINNLTDAKELHMALGWFYKCECNQLIYVMPSFVFDIDWKLLKSFIITKIEDQFMDNKLCLQYSSLTTGTINYSVPIKDIPENFYNKHNNIWS